MIIIMMHDITRYALRRLGYMVGRGYQKSQDCRARTQQVFVRVIVNHPTSVLCTVCLGKDDDLHSRSFFGN
jgi:hypothetical protein